VSIFIDTSVWFGAAVAKDRYNLRAKSILRSEKTLVTSDHVVIETWMLLNSRFRRDIAERFWHGLRQGKTRIEIVSTYDLETAWRISEAFSDQSFSIVDRTSFAIMERLGITRAASFDDDFVIYRYGRARDKAFEILR
jgi:uncharacterized protein